MISLRNRQFPVIARAGPSPEREPHRGAMLGALTHATLGHRGGREGGAMDPTNDVLVYSEIKSLLVNFEFFPGEKIRVGDLADRLRCSATPVREALHRLYAERLLSLAPKRGFIVRELDGAEFADLLRLQTLLLRLCIDEGCARRAGKELAALVAAETRPESVELSIAAIAESAGSEEILRIVRNILDRTHFVRQVHLDVDETRSTLSRHFGSLRTALADNDAKAAARALDQSLELALTMLPQTLKEALNRLYQKAHPLKSTQVQRPRF
jgi:DNA-binding GntR family transcriptional regulator